MTRRPPTTSPLARSPEGQRAFGAQPQKHMYCLSVIKSPSYQSPAKHAAPALTARDCSFCRSRSGLVLHSAVHRSTVFIYATDPRFPAILRSLKRRTQAGRNRLIESFF